MPMKKIKQILKCNKGFTLVEFITVFAFIVIMTGMSFVTLSIMHSARAKEAASTFESALANAVSSAKNIGVDYNMDGTIDDTEKNYALGIKIYYPDAGSKLYLQKCIFIAQPNGSYALWNLSYNDDYIKSINHNDGKGECLSQYVEIERTSVSGTKYTLSGYESYNICFNKKGECVSGYGEYEFLKKNGSTISRVQINKNGSYTASGKKEE